MEINKIPFLIQDPFLPAEIFDILDKINIGILIAREDGIVVWGNQHYGKITQSRISSLIGKSVEKINQIGDFKVLGQELIFSVLHREKKGINRIVDYHTKRDVIVMGTPIFDEKDDIRWIIYSLIDIDEVTELRRQLYQAFEETEAMRLRLQEASGGNLEHHGIIARDKAITDAYATALRVSRVEATLLILGETGTGKDKMAKYVHNVGPRKKGNFVHVNCSAIPEALFESELFGYEPGSFTGAAKQGKMGLIELANKGTLFLDEVAEMPLNMQAKMLTVLQEKKITRVGGIKPLPVDVRIIAATNRDLEEMVQKELFREDLFYRINVLEIRIPPLRERKDDIPTFINHFIKMYNEKYEQNKRFSEELFNEFLEYDWPGNVRELSHFIERLVIMCPNEVIDLEYLPKEMKKEKESWETREQEKETKRITKDFSEERERKIGFSKIAEEKVDWEGLMKEGVPLKTIMGQVEAEVIRETIARTATLREAAEQLGIELSTLTKKKQRYDIYKNKES